MLYCSVRRQPNAGGTWTNVDNVYTYTVSATSPCTENATATVTVIEQAKPNAGLDAELTVCEGTTITDDMLYDALAGKLKTKAEFGQYQEMYTLIQLQLRVHVHRCYSHSNSHRTSSA